MESRGARHLAAGTRRWLDSVCRVWRGISFGRRKPRSTDIAVNEAGLLINSAELPVSLTGEQRELLVYLLAHRGSVFTPESILSRLWWPERARDLEFLETIVAGLNKLMEAAGLAPDMIERFHGVGYRLRPEGETTSSK
jgi:DNA-binding response OmpR family regulator